MLLDLRKKILKQYKYAISFKKNYKGKVPLVKVKLGKNYYYLVVDSGASINMLDGKIVESMEKEIFIPTDNQKVIETASQAFTGKTVIASPAIGRHKFTDTEFVVSTELYKALETIQEKIDSKIPIIGLIGSGFLEKYAWSIDFDEMVIWIKN